MNYKKNVIICAFLIQKISVLCYAVKEETISGKGYILYIRI